jgi:hypothetical protein
MIDLKPLVIICFEAAFNSSKGIFHCQLCEVNFEWKLLKSSQQHYTIYWFSYTTKVVFKSFFSLPPQYVLFLFFNNALEIFENNGPNFPIALI